MKKPHDQGELAQGKEVGHRLPHLTLPAPEIQAYLLVFWSFLPVLPSLLDIVQEVVS